MSSEEYSDGDTTISSKYNNRLLAPNMLCMLLVILFGIVASTCNVISCCNVSTGESEIGTVGPNRLSKVFWRVVRVLGQEEPGVELLQVSVCVLISCNLT